MEQKRKMKKGRTTITKLFFRELRNFAQHNKRVIFKLTIVSVILVITFIVIENLQVIIDGFRAGWNEQG